MITPAWGIPRVYEAEREEHVHVTADVALRLVGSRVAEASELIVGDAAPALTEASEQLDLLVCGSRGYGAVRSVLLGSVSRRLAHTTACPLMVVPRAAIKEGREIGAPPRGCALELIAGTRTQ